MTVYLYLTIIPNLFVCLSINSSQTIGTKGLKFSGLERGYPGMVIRKFGEDRFVQQLLPDDWVSKGLQFLGFDGDYPGVVIRNLVKIVVKPCKWGYIFSKFPSWGHNSMPE